MKYKINAYYTIEGPKFRIVDEYGGVIASSGAFRDDNAMKEVFNELIKEHNFEITEGYRWWREDLET